VADTFWSTDFWAAGFWADGFWTNEGAPTPTPVDATPTPAGKSKHRRKFYVEIDGQRFDVASVAEATELLQRARAIAERQAEEKSARATKVLRRKKVVPKVEIPAPQIKASPEVRAEIAPLIRDIERLYAKAEVEAELRLLLLKQMRDEDEDDEEALLLL
jgi:hypothetical protein